MENRKQNKQATWFIIFIVIFWALMAFVIFSASAQEPFAGKTKHKTVKKMSKRQVRKAQNGKTYYYRTKSGKLKKRRRW